MEPEGKKEKDKQRGAATLMSGNDMPHRPCI